MAFETSAIFRTCPVRLLAIRFTLSVRSFHVPATPLTSAWPPSLPSVPTSRATRVTSEPNEFSWSTIELSVFLSSRISPRTSTVIFLERSPLAMAVETSAMLRTCPVRLLAIRFTLSVRSFHVPAIPLTLACPPSLPSVPTSRATRVTSEANKVSCSTIVLTILAVCRNSPLSGRPSISRAVVWDRSPLATARITRAVSAVGCTKSVISVFTELTLSIHDPSAAPIDARWVIFPSLPTTVLIRSSSFVILLLSSMMSLSMSAIFPAIPVYSTGIRTEKSPFLTAISTLNNCSISRVSELPSADCPAGIALYLHN